MTKKQDAYHESGHAIAALVYGHHFKNVNIIHKKKSDGRLSGYIGGFPLDCAIVYYSGAIACSKIGDGIIFCGGENDVRYAHEQIAWVCDYLLKPDRFEEVRRDIYSSAEWLVDNNWAQIEVVAEKLIKKKKILYGDVIKLLIKNDLFNSLKMPERLKL